MQLINSIDKAVDVLHQNSEIYLANSLLASALQRNQYDERIIYDLGKGFIKNRNFESAQKCFQYLKVKLNNFESYFFFAKSSEALGQVEAARDAYLDALLLPTVDSDLLFEAYKNIGNIYLKESNIEVAEDFYHKAYTIKSESPTLLVNLGTLELQRLNTSGAIERFRSALKVDPKFSPAWLGLALSYDDFGDFPMAWASLLRSVECDSRNATALLLLAQWSVKNEGVNKAIHYLSQYFDSGFFDNQLSLVFIELCLHSNNYGLARWELERALHWDPKSVELNSFDQVLRQHGH